MSVGVASFVANDRATMSTRSGCVRSTDRSYAAPRLLRHLRDADDVQRAENPSSLGCVLFRPGQLRPRLQGQRLLVEHPALARDAEAFLELAPCFVRQPSEAKRVPAHTM